MCLEMVSKFATFFDDILIVDLDNNKVKTQKPLPLISQQRKQHVLNCLKSPECVGEGMQYSKFFQVVDHDSVPDFENEDELHQVMKGVSLGGLDYASCPYPCSALDKFGKTESETVSEKDVGKNLSNGIPRRVKVKSDEKERPPVSV